MKTLALINGLFVQGKRSGGIPRELFERLIAIYPEGRFGDQRPCFKASLEFDDPRTRAILELLEGNGMRPWPKRGEKSDTEYTFSLRRAYDDVDFKTFDYLELDPLYNESVVPGEPRVAGRIVTELQEPGKADICKLGSSGCVFVAVQRARDVLEAANLSGLKFLPVEKSYDSVDYDLYDEEDTWWELESDLELPPLAPSMTLETRDGKPFRGDFTEGCIRREGFYTHPELHYRRADLERIGPFDAARTFEHFHPRGPAPLSRALVVSKRFYEVCKQNNIKTRFVPVRLDDIDAA